MALLLATISVPLLLQRSLSKIDTDFRVAQTRAIKTKANLDKLEADLNAALKAILERHRETLCGLSARFMECRISALEDRLVGAERYELHSGDIAVIGSASDYIGPLPTDTREIHVFDRSTNEEFLVLIVHIFDGVAYWEFAQTQLFVAADDKTDIHLWRFLSMDAAISKFEQFSLVAGIGLESNSGEADKGYSAARARHLCTSLDNLLGERGNTSALGLDVGPYRGAAKEGRDTRNPLLRPVVIVGIKAGKQADFETFARELLSKVQLPGLDMGMFEYLSADQKPVWYLPPNCKPDYAFVAPANRSPA